MGNVLDSARSTPASSFDMSSNVEIRLSAELKAPSRCNVSSRISSVEARSDNEVVKSLAALSGCSKSCDAAAKKRVFDKLASSVAFIA